MADYVVMPKSDYQDILDATREKTGKSDLLLSGEVGAEIRTIVSGGIIPSGSLDITENGEHDVLNYEKASVNVPVPDGYVQPSGTKQITENGTYDVREYEFAEVDAETPTEEVTVVLDLSDGDQIITPSEGTAISKATITKPSTLIPSNIKNGSMIAGVTGNYETPTEEKTVTLDFSGGDQVIESSDGKVISKMTIEKPDTLLPANIVEGSTIAGVTGSAPKIETCTVNVTMNNYGLRRIGYTVSSDGALVAQQKTYTWTASSYTREGTVVAVCGSMLAIIVQGTTFSITCENAELLTSYSATALFNITAGAGETATITFTY